MCSPRKYAGDCRLSLKKIKLFVTIMGLWLTGLQGAYTQQSGLPYISGKISVHDSASHVIVSVILTHQPSGTRYATLAETPGYFHFNNLRLGGPYILVCSAAGYEADTVSFQDMKTGNSHFFEILLSPRFKQMEELLIGSYTQKKSLIENTAQRFIISSNVIEQMPASARTINELFRLHPFYSAGGFIGKSPRFNAFTVDGSLLASFGLNNTIIPGNAADTDPLSLDAIDQLEISLAPVEITQYGFSGAGVNITSKKGENKPGAGIYCYLQSGSINKRIREEAGNKRQQVYGAFAGGAIKKDKLFYYLNYEWKKTVYPGTVYKTSKGLSQADAFTTRVLQSDMDSLSSFLNRYYDYSTGSYENYSQSASSHKLSFQLDWNINDNHKLDLKLISLNAAIGRLLTNSDIFGVGGRNGNLYSLHFKNSNYIRTNNAFSTRLEYNYTISANISNQLFFNYSFFNDSRQITGPAVPLVDILKDGLNYISFGADPFAPENKVTNNIIQLQDNFSWQRRRHLLTAGFNMEIINASNSFLPGWNGAFLFRSLEEFYHSFPAGTVTPAGVSDGSKLPLTYTRNVSLVSDKKIPTVKPSYRNISVYGEDKWQVSRSVLLSLSLRAERISHPVKPLYNPLVADLDFRDHNNRTLKINTATLPRPTWQVSPRVGLRSGLVKKKLTINFSSGLYTGRLPMVLLSEQFRNNGRLFGTIRLTEADIPGFDFSTAAYDNLPALSHSLDIVAFSPDFRYPQAWRSAAGISYQLSTKSQVSVNLLYSKDIHAVRFYNVNINNDSLATGANGRVYLLQPSVNSPYVRNAYYISNYSSARQFFINVYYRFSVKDKILVAASYTHGSSKDISSLTGTEPQSDFNNLAVSGNPNYPQLSHSTYDMPHRVYILFNGHIQLDPVKKRQMSIGLFAEAVQPGRYSFVYSGRGDVNGDGIYGNDLIFVPAASNQINLASYTDNNGHTVSVQEQWQALDRFISGNKYLNHRRGKLAERNSATLPFTFSNDVRLSYSSNMGKKFTATFSLDIFNLVNLLHASWNLGKVPFTGQPVEALTPNSFIVYPERISRQFAANSGAVNGWQLQLGFRLSLQ